MVHLTVFDFKTRLQSRDWMLDRNVRRSEPTWKGCELGRHINVARAIIWLNSGCPFSGGEEVSLSVTLFSSSADSDTERGGSNSITTIRMNSWSSSQVTLDLFTPLRLVDLILIKLRFNYDDFCPVMSSIRNKLTNFSYYFRLVFDFSSRRSQNNNRNPYISIIVIMYR